MTEKERHAIEEKIKSALPADAVGKPDLLAVFNKPTLLPSMAKWLAEPYKGKIDYVMAPEAVGWILGTAIAVQLGVPFVGIRKGGHSPYPKNSEKVLRFTYTDYSKKQKVLEVTRNAIEPNSRVLIADDWVETGAAMTACAQIIKEFNSTIAGVVTVQTMFEEMMNHN